MMLGSTTCPQIDEGECECCVRMTAQFERWKQETLDEVNVYRKLLRLPLLSELALSQPCTLSTTTATTATPRTSTLSIQSLPPEILDRIVSYTDASSIIPLCHCLPQYLPLSKAIYDVGTAFPGFYSGPTLLWPILEFPSGSIEKAEHPPTDENDVFNYDDDFIPMEIPVRHVLKLFLLTRQLDRYGGGASIIPFSVEHLESVAPLLPKLVIVNEVPEEISYDYDVDTFAHWLKKWLSLKIKSFIGMLNIPADLSEDILEPDTELVAKCLVKIPIGGLTFPGMIPLDIEKSLPEMIHLRELHVGDLDGFNSAFLKDCVRLRVLAFTVSEDGVDIQAVEDLLPVLPHCESIDEVRFQSFALSQVDLDMLNAKCQELIGWASKPVSLEDPTLGVCCLQSLPREILDAIVSYTSGDSIFALCHSLPQYLPLSKAIHDVATSFPGLYSGVHRLKSLWPSLKIPNGIKAHERWDSSHHDEDDSGEEGTVAGPRIPARLLTKLHILTKYLNRFGGEVVIAPYSVKHLSIVAPLLPKFVTIQIVPFQISVNVKNIDNFAEWLEKWKSLGIKSFIRMIDVHLCFAPIDVCHRAAKILSEISICGLSFFLKIPAVIAKALPTMKYLKKLRVGCLEGFDWSVLKDCVHLRELELFDLMATLDVDILTDLVSKLSFCKHVTYVRFSSFRFGNFQSEDWNVLFEIGDELEGWMCGPVVSKNGSLFIEWIRQS
ncbi:hypothetical protein BCR33DRAFT_760870 [Rhizoclosmatium globosum]|uniref:F-box domain-containing protein n=1 Tax=Rhizoclosmatium globosum TaxID=329046 RepID=A0A1Y2D288_9FUNG|nr:hypothetical protein BCR33DRAFT_760870 [Rhizoclosmatium globosum]|eukprot:ORY53413.1 hypothetical protein BCR33DRAFT_760870 [Rhizoclosmatium globosum]